MSVVHHYLAEPTKIPEIQNLKGIFRNSNPTIDINVFSITVNYRHLEVRIIQLPLIPRQKIQPE
jgi:hypothetical protein